MLVSQPALVYLEVNWRRLCGRVLAAVGRRPSRPAAEDESEPLVPRAVGERAWTGAPSPPSVVTPLLAVPTGIAARGDGWAGAPGGLAPLPRPAASPAPAPDSTLPHQRPTAIERRARAACFRAVLLARQRRFAEAQTAFADALRLDPAVDLTAGEGFWDLERAAHDAAIRAYEAAGRSRSALELRARIGVRFRPRLVRSA